MNNELSTNVEMTVDEAQSWKQDVVSHVTQLRVLLDEGHRRSVWRSLGFTSWTDCLKSLAVEFGLSERRLWQLHSANQTERLLNPGSVGEIPEKHLRPLANLKADEVSEVWQKAKETAPNGKVTTAHIEQTISKYFQKADAPHGEQALRDDAAFVFVLKKYSADYDNVVKALFSIRQFFNDTLFNDPGIHWVVVRRLTSAEQVASEFILRHRALMEYSNLKPQIEDALNDIEALREETRAMFYEWEAKLPKGAFDGFYELTINPEFQSLLPPLTESEFSKLEASILQHGVITPLDVWDGVLLDGHQRYAIAEKHSIPFKTVEMQFDDETEAKIWIIETQLARKNLSTYEQAELLLKAHEYQARVN
jgi:hypothetical protein